MFPVGGSHVMLLGAGIAAVLIGLAAAAATRLSRARPWLVWTVAALLWSLAVIGLVTLIPATAAPGIVPAEGRLTTCSWDIGGPAPEGFWIFSSGQRLLNTVLFVPSGALVVVAGAGGARRPVLRWVLVPIGLMLLATYSVLIEATQLELARIDRACDVTDVVDNVTGALLGAGLGLVLVALLALGGRLLGSGRDHPTDPRHPR